MYKYKNLLYNVFHVVDSTVIDSSHQGPKTQQISLLKNEVDHFKSIKSGVNLKTGVHIFSKKSFPPPF